MRQNLQEQTQEWLRGQSTPEETSRTVRRLLARRLDEQVGDSDERWISSALPLWSEEDYTLSVARAVGKAVRAHARLETEREAAQPAVERYVGSKWQGRPSQPSGEDSASQTWAFVHRLVMENWEVDHPDPVQAVQLAQRITDFAMGLDATVYGVERVQDLRALAWTKLANAFRIQSMFRRAEQAFARAAEELSAGTGDPLVAARIQFFEVSFHGIQERYDQAFQLVDRIVGIARRFGDRHLMGKTLLSRAYFEKNAGNSEEAVRLSHRGLRLIDTSQEPRLVLVAWHNLVMLLTEQGRYREAIQRLPYLRTLHQRFGNRQDRLRLEWFEGKIDLAMGRVESAEKALMKVREGFIRLDVGFEAALVSLDLASLYSEQGRTQDMRRLSEEMLPIFQSRDMHREAIAALLVFKRATELDQVSVNLVDDLASFLRRSRSNKQLRFERQS